MTCLVHSEWCSVYLRHVGVRALEREGLENDSSTFRNEFEHLKRFLFLLPLPCSDPPCLSVRQSLVSTCLPAFSIIPLSLSSNLLCQRGLPKTWKCLCHGSALKAPQWLLPAIDSFLLMLARVSFCCLQWRTLIYGPLPWLPLIPLVPYPPWLLYTESILPMLIYQIIMNLFSNVDIMSISLSSLRKGTGFCSCRYFQFLE